VNWRREERNAAFLAVMAAVDAQPAYATHTALGKSPI
jgi:hypothetical protein